MNKQSQFLKMYEPVHESFERFCKARAYGDMDFEDLMNETLLVAFQKFDELKNSEHFLSFLIGVSIRILANNNRKNKPDIIDVQQYSNVESNLKTEQDAEVYLLYQCLNELPIEQKEAIILFEISGFSIKEISEIQSVSLSAVKQRLKRGRERLVKLLTFEKKQEKEVKYGC